MSQIEKPLLMRMTGIIDTLETWKTMFGAIEEEILIHPKTQKLIHSNEKFDVVIVPEVNIPALRAFAHHFQGSLVLFVISGSINWYLDQVGNILLPSIEPLDSTDIPQRMSFLRRLGNIYYKINAMRWLRNHLVEQEKLVVKYFPNSSSLVNISKNISLVLVNTGSSIEPVRPIVPNIINIGGFHMKKSRILPWTLRKIIDKANNGVIFLNIGSLMDRNIIPKRKLAQVLRMFGKRNETVIWKYSQEFQKTPQNVFITKWVHQQEILGKFFTIPINFHSIKKVM